MCYSATSVHQHHINMVSITAPVFLTLVLCFSGVFAADEYVAEIAEECNAKSDLFSCGKYEAAKFITKAASSGTPSKVKVIDGLVDFVTLDKPETTDSLFPSAARQMSSDSQFRKFVKFVQRQVDAYLGSRAISITLPGQTRIVDAEDPSNEIDSEGKVEFRAKKKKASMLVPLIILFKLFKVKVMLALVLFGVVFIKKAIMFVLLLAPSYLQMLKVCKTPHYGHPHIEEHDFGSTGYGHAYAGHHPHSSYAKDWSNSRAYAAHKPT